MAGIGGPSPPSSGIGTGGIGYIRKPKSKRTGGEGGLPSPKSAPVQPAAAKPKAAAVAAPTTPAWTPTPVAGPTAPTIGQLKPEAAYDPELAKELEAQRGYRGQLESGTGFAMDVLTTTQADQLESQVAQARAAAEQAGIPFNEGAFRAQAMKGINAAMAEEKLGREKMVGEAHRAAAELAGAQAGERTQRLGIDLSRDVSQEQLGLQRYASEIAKYGQDISKYGIDAQAATAANNALLGFYSQLMGGIFGAMSPSFSSQQYYA